MSGYSSQAPLYTEWARIWSCEPLERATKRVIVFLVVT